jgi:hypothetical protein
MALALLSACSGGGGGTDAGGDAAPGDAVADVPVDAAPPLDCRDGGGAGCFELPAAPVMAIDNDAAVAPDFTCAPPPPAQSTATIAVAGTVSDFQTGGRLPDATVAVFRDDGFTGTPLAMATSDAMGAFAFTLPVGTPNILYWRTRAPSALDTFLIGNPIDVTAAMITAARVSVSLSTAGGLAALIGLQRMMGTGIVAGEAIDCRLRRLSGAVITLSSTSSLASGAPPTFVPGAQAYYFDVAPDLPTSRLQQNTTNTNGLFLLIQVPPSPGTDRVYAQLWGFRTMADVGRGMAGLTLLAERPLRVAPDVMLIPDMTPRMLP